MKAILMAAGVGSRISEYTNEPKSLLKVNGQAIIRHTVEMLQKNGIDVTIIVGFKHQLIEKELKGLNVKFYHNPFYRVTNSIASLWIAREELNTSEDVILGNADVYYDQDILDELIHSEKETIMLGDETRRLTGDYFFWCKNDRIEKYGKELVPEERTCEYVGLAKIKNSFLPEFKKQTEKLVDEGEYNLWWENALYSIAHEYPIYVEDVDGKFWAEVDTIDDYNRIKSTIEKKK